MNTQLKKGDKCQSPWGVVTINNIQPYGIIGVIDKDGYYYAANIKQLTRIPTHAERMQAMLDIAWDSENRLEPHEVVQLHVGAFVEFARHYCLLRDDLEYEQSLFDGKKAIMEVRQRNIEKALKGEES